MRCDCGLKRVSHGVSVSDLMVHTPAVLAQVFLSASGDVRLGDFGLSRSFDSSSSLASTVCGTPYYLSPEQVTDAHTPS